MEHWLRTKGGLRRFTTAHFELGPGDAVDEGRRMAWVDAVEELTVLIATGGGLPCDRACDFGLAVREALVNALKHGRDASQCVAVAFRLVGGPALEVTVRDGGPGFNPEAVPDPRRPENLSRGCGRGVFYMKQFADDLAFRFPRTGGTVTRMRKRLPRRGVVADPGLTEWMGPLPAARPAPAAGGQVA